MAKLVNYTCPICGQDYEEIFNDTEEIPDELYIICTKCDNAVIFKKNNMKNNCHRWSYLDRNGA